MPSHPKRSLTSISGVHKISPSYSLTFLYSVYKRCPSAQTFVRILLSFSFCVSISPRTSHSLPFLSSSFSSLLAQLSTIGVGGWLAPTGMFSVWLLSGQQADTQCVYACMRVCFDVFSDPATSSTCDILPPESDPAGHSHTQERWRRTHHLNLPVTFRIFACWVLISFFLFFLYFPVSNEEPGHISFLCLLAAWWNAVIDESVAF